MIERKQYESGVITFGSVGKTWTFNVANCYSFVTPCPGGFKTAEKVAAAITSSIARTKTYVEPIDGLCRWTVGQIVRG